MNDMAWCYEYMCASYVKKHL